MDWIFKHFGWVMGGILAIGIAGVAGQMLVANKNGCLESMVLNGVCLSTPVVDEAVKNVIK